MLISEYCFLYLQIYLSFRCPGSRGKLYVCAPLTKIEGIKQKNQSLPARRHKQANQSLNCICMIYLSCKVMAHQLQHEGNICSLSLSIYPFIIVCHHLLFDGITSYFIAANNCNYSFIALLCIPLFSFFLFNICNKKVFKCTTIEACK